MNALLGKVIMFCGSSRGDANDCVEWAVEAMCSGEDSPNLRILAGLVPPLSSFEVRDYASKALRELEIEVPHGAEAISAYARDLVEEIVNSPEIMQGNLKLLCELCMAENYQRDIFDFYLLRWAYDDLQLARDQSYWRGAERSNIQEIILDRCHEWLSECKTKREQIDAD